MTDATFSPPTRPARSSRLRRPRAVRRLQLPLPSIRVPIGLVKDLALRLAGFQPSAAATVVLMVAALLTTTTSVAVVLHSSLAVASKAPASQIMSGLARAGATAGPPTGQLIPAQAPATAAPTPPAAPSPAFRPVHHLVVPTLLVSAAKPLTPARLRAISALPGVRRTQPLLAGRIAIAGHSAFTIGADPQALRRWTPALTANSQPLWDSVDSGDLITSFDLGENARLPLGADVSVASRVGITPLRLGALASIGMAGVDAAVSGPQAAELGLRPRTGLLISAPGANPLALRRAVLQQLRGHGHVGVLNEVIVTRDAGEFMTRLQIETFLHAAASRVGLPYVWGAAGPNAFDCSGLVQWSFARAGIRMPRVAQDQFFTGPHIPYADARPGDLLFWHYEPNDPTYVSHVAIYVGDGEMLVAPHTGADVQLAPVPLPDMAGVVRVDPAIAARVGG